MEILLTHTIDSKIPEDDPANFLSRYYQDLQSQHTGNKNWAAAGKGVVLVTSGPQPSVDAAQLYAEIHCTKGGRAFAIPYYGQVSDYDEKSKVVFQKVSVATKEVESRHDRTHAEVQATKSKTKGCPVCGSSINRQYIKRYCDCPVCGAKQVLMSASQEKYINVAVTKMNEAMKLSRTLVKKAGVGYLLAASVGE